MQSESYRRSWIVNECGAFGCGYPVGRTNHTTFSVSSDEGRYGDVEVEINFDYSYIFNTTLENWNTGANTAYVSAGLNGASEGEYVFIDAGIWRVSSSQNADEWEMAGQLTMNVLVDLYETHKIDLWSYADAYMDWQGTELQTMPGIFTTLRSEIILTSIVAPDELSSDPDPVAPVPEPSTIVLLGTGLISLAGFGRKKFRK